MEKVVLFLLVSLATYRAAFMIASERGPWDVFHKLRTAVYKRWPDKDTSPKIVDQSDSVYLVTSHTPVIESSWQFSGVTCVDCLSFWLAWLTVAALPFEGVAMYAVNALAVSAVCVLINHNTK